MKKERGYHGNPFPKKIFHKLLQKCIRLYIIVTNPEDIIIFSVAFIEMR